MTTACSQTSQNTLNFLKNSQIVGLFCKNLVARLKLMSSSGRFPAKLIFFILQLWKNCDKLLREYTLYLEPQFAESKKPKQNRVKSRKNNFVETFSLNLLKGCALLLQFLKIFHFCFMFSTTLLSYKQKYRADRSLSGARGPRHLEKT